MDQNPPHAKRPVDQWFLFWLASLLFVFILLMLGILIWRYDNAGDVSSIAGVAVSPASALIGGIFGHHVGSRRQG